MTSKSLSQRLILFCLLFIALASLLIFAHPAAAQCVPPECYPTDVPYEMPVEPAGGAWGGYSDGRLNPDMAEQYTVYCSNDLVEIWGGTPSPQLISTIPIIDLFSLSDGGSLNAPPDLTITRSTSDTITIHGSSGYNAPTPGSKSFSLSECIARNGGTPELPPQPPAGNGAANPPPEVPPQEAERRREAQERLDFCYDSYAFLNDTWLLAGCLNDTLADYSDALDGSIILSLILMVFCLNIFAGNGIVPIGIVAFLGWHRRWLRKQKTLE
jgi:hypothetical protein